MENVLVDLNLSECRIWVHRVGADHRVGVPECVDPARKTAGPLRIGRGIKDECNSPRVAGDDPWEQHLSQVRAGSDRTAWASVKLDGGVPCLALVSRVRDESLARRCPGT